ncbi:unnamed protein product [Trichobilharzia regenti]|nr:unnamed protein product [Trichobilharzia regenti]
MKLPDIVFSRVFLLNIFLSSSFITYSLNCCQATFDIVAVTDDNEPTLFSRQFQMSIEEALNRIAAQNQDSQPVLSTSQLTELMGRDGSAGYQGPVLQEFTNIAKSITRYRPRNSSIRNDQNVWMQRQLEVLSLGPKFSDYAPKVDQLDPDIRFENLYSQTLNLTPSSDDELTRFKTTLVDSCQQ